MVGTGLGGNEIRAKPGRSSCEAAGRHRALRTQPGPCRPVTVGRPAGRSPHPQRGLRNGPARTPEAETTVINHIRMTRLDDDLRLDLVELPQEDPDVLGLRGSEPAEDVEGLG
ncbi:hypothetical protein Psi02_06830 [Planotetraspora silvatica]|uniref:Uncharacterized protein n=1 Tax=Planotetraspora silvatica TaxID=234614 RepID=A0A8J3UEU0_9ACTN|nr:hypothetical protein Psi02_06830 [Planotetraspora silvatica]